ncbi:hypothetical protein LRP88_14910 [Fusarium phalaenopsidis]
MSHSSSSPAVASAGKRRLSHAIEERQTKRTHREPESRSQTLFFGLELEFACPALDESIGEGGEHDYLRQCHSIYENLASELTDRGRETVISLVVRHDQFSSNGMGEESHLSWGAAAVGKARQSDTQRATRLSPDIPTVVPLQ